MRDHARRLCAQKKTTTALFAVSGRRLLRLLTLTAVLAASACTTIFPSAVANRPDGEGYAGVGELIVRIRVMGQNTGWFDRLMPPSKNARATVELRYLGINSAGRAVFERRDLDNLAGAPVVSTPAAGSGLEPGTTAAGLPPDTRDILLDLRLARQIRIQGKIIEIVEASDTGVVFRLY